jgi:DHA1 family purine ribonucleoside efflux pump-like MFS transporter
MLLGVSLGGFWAMAASLAMRLVPAELVPRALSIIFGGVSVSMVVAAPLGTFLGAIIGWRGVFAIAAVTAGAVLAWQFRALPSLPFLADVTQGGPSLVARRRGVPLAMLGIFMVFAGQFAFFSYMRPFFEQVSGFEVGGLSALLLGFGIANFAGTAASAPLLRARLKATLVGAPLVLAFCALGLVVFGRNQALVGMILCIWGFAFGAIPVGWSTWVTRHVADDAESGGGLQVAVIQLANSVGAALGGWVLEASSVFAPVVTAGVLMVAAAAVVAVGGDSHTEVVRG